MALVFLPVTKVLISHASSKARRSSFWIDPENTAPFIGNQRTLLKAYADDHWSKKIVTCMLLWPRLSATKRTNNYQKKVRGSRGDGSFFTG